MYVQYIQKGERKSDRIASQERKMPRELHLGNDVYAMK